MARRWLAVAAVVLAGVAIGLGAFTFVYARGYSYLTSDPEACANCHVMDEHFAAWLKSSHRAAAGCNDCHTPHDPVGKWTTKARNGFWHSFYFTTGNFPYPLRITERNRDVVGEACRDCHAGLVASMTPGHILTLPGDGAAVGEPAQDELACTHCHRYVGHWVR